MRKITVLHSLPWTMARSPEKHEGPDWEDAIYAEVPGNIVADLHRAGLVPEPYYGENFRAVQWTENWYFWYRTEFTISGNEWSNGTNQDRFLLNLEGVDTFAEVFFNGQSLGTIQNMFRRFEFDITPYLQADKSNELIIRIDPPLKGAQAWAMSQQINLDDLPVPVFGYKERLISRKAQMSYGWDQTPALLAGGIIRPVYLERRRGPVISNYHWNVTGLDIDKETAELVIAGTVSEQFKGSVAVSGRCGDRRFAGEGKVSGDQWSLNLTVTDALYWWPNGMGQPNLYRTTITLRDASGVTVDESVLELGLRTIRVLNEPKISRWVDYRIGRRTLKGSGDVMDGGNLGPWERVDLPAPEQVKASPFKLIVNDKEVFIKGFNWQNAEALIGCERIDKIEVLCDTARSAHANMLRLWGGGAVELDGFYETCSR